MACFGGMTVFHHTTSCPRAMMEDCASYFPPRTWMPVLILVLCQFSHTWHFFVGRYESNDKLAVFEYRLAILVCQQWQLSKSLVCNRLKMRPLPSKNRLRQSREKDSKTDCAVTGPWHIFCSLSKHLGDMMLGNRPFDNGIFVKRHLGNSLMTVKMLKEKTFG